MRYSASPLAGLQTIVASNVISSVLTLTQDYGYAFHAIWTSASGPLIGTVKLQASIDGVTYSDVANSEQAVNGTGSYLWNVQTALYIYARCVFTYTSGAGSITFWASTKGP